MTSQNSAEAGVDATGHEDRAAGPEGPLFYTLPQSVQDSLTAHFLALGSETRALFGDAPRPSDPGIRLVA